jgi:hypothetical protein
VPPKPTTASVGIEWVGPLRSDVDVLGGFVRLTRADDGHAWAWAGAIGPAIGQIALRDHELGFPRRGHEVRGDGIWLDLVEEAPGEHWSVGLESFALRYASASDALAGERGERIPFGLEIEWEVLPDAGDATPGRVPGRVHGAVLVERDRFPIEGGGFLCLDDALPPVNDPWRCAWYDAEGVPHGGEGRTPAAECLELATLIVPCGRDRLDRSIVAVAVEGRPPGAGWSEVRRAIDAPA